MIRVILHGALGNMGRFLAPLVQAEADMHIVAGVDTAAGQATMPLYDHLGKVQEPADVLIDFSDPRALPDLCAFAVAKAMPLIVGTTGLKEAHYRLLREASRQIPVFQSPNMHLGIHVFLEIVRQMVGYLHDWDIEIIDTHHRYKIDAPSGTAERIMSIIQEIRPQTRFVHDRSRMRSKRDKSEVGVVSVRGGSIVGGHQVQFLGDEEVIELRNLVSTRQVLGRGAIETIRWMAAQPKGLYSSQDIIESRKAKAR